ncbi:hypothetical protein BBJ28_00022319 [Nothophytophthora sp. Chile5]|nr:hypothetical protein BBJ28_00022319 [Nothophytophthora sp. Chile5]
MAALPPRSALPALADSELRDPTREELHTGPVRALPEEIQQLPVEDTACTFCGVSYFVFAEVQALQTTVKQYKKTFHQFVRFMERERQASQDLRQEVTALKSSFAQLVDNCSVSTRQLSEKCEEQCSANRETSSELQRVRQELLESQDAHKQLLVISKRVEDELKVASSLTEQKLRNEILHLSSQIENCKVQSESQQATIVAEREREQQIIRELETQLAEAQAHWTTVERQLVSERDTLKQKLLVVTERVELEKTTTQQLEAQLTAIRGELTRVVTTSDAERKSFSQASSEIIQLKHQLQALEKSRSQLLSDGARQKEELTKQDEELRCLRRQADHVQGQLAVSLASTEKVKSDYARSLEKLRGEYSVELSHLHRNHAKAIEELKVSQQEYLEYLKKETAELLSQGKQSSQQAILATEEQEIALLQQTVHRECMERTSLLERMRSGKVLPDVSTPSASAPAVFGDSRNSSTNRRSVNQSLDQRSVDDDDGDDEQLGYSAGEQQPKASFYEKLRRAGHRKTKPRK